MALSEHEQQKLDEIAQHLAEEDPRFAPEFGKSRPTIFGMSRRTAAVLAVLVYFVAGLEAMVVGVTMSSWVIIALGAAITIGVFVWLIMRVWRARGR